MRKEVKRKYWGFLRSIKSGNKRRTDLPGFQCHKQCKGFQTMMATINKVTLSQRERLRLTPL